MIDFLSNIKLEDVIVIPILGLFGTAMALTFIAIGRLFVKWITGEKWGGEGEGED